MHRCAYKKCIFHSYNIYFECFVFRWKSFHMTSVKNKDRNSDGFQILHFYWSFSSDIMAVKGLSAPTLE